MALYHELDNIAVAVLICSQSRGAGCLAPNQADILDRVAQAMSHDGIKPIDDGGNDLLIPEEETTIAYSRIEDKTHPDIVALALHAVNPSAFASEAHPLRLPNTDPIDRLIGTSRQGLGHCAVKVVSDP